MSKERQAKLYLEMVNNEGYRGSLDEDGDVVFKQEGRTYVIIVDENDDVFFRLVFPNFWPIESDEERLRVLLAADHATRETKVAKIFTVRENVWGAIEMFVGSPEAAKPVFNRCISALRTAVGTFVEKMRSMEQ